MLPQVYNEEYLVGKFLTRFSILLHREGAQLAGRCPYCNDGERRFVVWKEGNYWCRVCGSKGWVDEDQPRWKPDPERHQRWLAEQAELERQRKERIAAYRAGFQAGRVRGWHEAMQATHIEYWHSQGIPDAAIERYQLGFCARKRVDVNGEKIELPAYTIPIFDPRTHELANVQYRLMDPVPPMVHKYRQHPGIPSAAFYADPEKLGGKCLLVEGSKKAIVVYLVTEGAIQVVGLPGATPSEELMDQLKVFEVIYLMLDPDTDWQKERIAQYLAPRVRIVDMLTKPDDLVVQYNKDKAYFRTLIRYGRKPHGSAIQRVR